jgi:hypothetical protein
MCKYTVKRSNINYSSIKEILAQGWCGVLCGSLLKGLSSCRLAPGIPARSVIGHKGDQSGVKTPANRHSEKSSILENSSLQTSINQLIEHYYWQQTRPIMTTSM